LRKKRSYMNKRAIYTIASHIFKMNLSVQMMFIISFVLIAGDYLNLTLKSAAYTFSLTLEELLLFAMPGIIFSYLFSCLISFKNKALKLVSFLLVTVSFSNFVSAILAYIFGNFALSRIHLNLQPSPQISRQLLPLWDFELPYMISSEHALIIALVLGIIFSIYPSEQIEWTAQKLKKAVNLFLGKIFTPLLPLFILGFILKMQYEGALITIIQNYGQVFVIIITIYIIYIAILYFVAAKFNSKKAYLYFKNTLPSGLMGFATMSSIIAMPVTLRAAKKIPKALSLLKH
jgi:Na+/H+-dicarboxylate symporter